MAKFCISCGKSLPAEARFCDACGTSQPDAASTLPAAEEEIQPAPTAPEPVVEPTYVAPIADTVSAQSTSAEASFVTDTDDNSSRNRLLLIGGAVGTLLLVALLYFFLFVADDLGSSSTGSTPNTTGEAVADEAKSLFAVTEVNIRDKPTTTGSTIIGKLPRGSAVSGILRIAEGGTDNWLELSEGKGYISAVNLSEFEPPVIAKPLGDKIWAADTAIDIWAQPDAASTLVDRVAAGTKLTLAGITANDFIEVKLKKGGVGYIADGAAIAARANGKPIAIAFNPRSCSFGPEIDAIFERIGAKLRADWEALEDREYPTEEARNNALNKAEGRSTYERVQRSYNGLSLVAIGQHYESQSIHFADPPAKVIEVFRAQGYKIGSDGQFPSTDIYAGIAATRSDVPGKTELGCGV